MKLIRLTRDVLNYGKKDEILEVSNWQSKYLIDECGAELIEDLGLWRRGDKRHAPPKGK